MQASTEPNSTGLTLSQLEHLCQPEQLERTFYLLFNMNHWAKAREQLFFVDRQGLYAVKAALLKQAYAIGAIEATAYIDGTPGFGKDITLAIAADIAAEGVIERLAGLSDPDPSQQIHKLKNAPSTSRELGEYYGRPITESESLQKPIREILREMGVDIEAICPRQLSNKQEYLLAQAARYDEWDEDWSYSDEDEELDDEVWNDEYTPENKKQSQQAPTLLETENCPLCLTRVNTPGIPRIDHWRQAHPGQDLTISQASWILNRSTNRDQFCTDIPPDYRVPIEGVKGKGTRYWKLETLETCGLRKK